MTLSLKIKFGELEIKKGSKNKGIETDKITEDISKVKEELDDITDSIKRDL